MRFLTIGTGAAIALASPAAAQVMTPSDYVAKAGASDLYEQTSSRIVLESTRDPKVRAFARMMITAHTKSTADVKAAAAQSHIRVAPAKLSPDQTKMIAKLTGERGSTRDATYIAQQRTAHGEALAVQQAYAKEGTAPALRRAAAGIVPVVQQHISQLKAM